MVPPPKHVSPTSSLPRTGFTPQPLRGMGSSSSYQPKPMDVFSSSPLYTHTTPLAINGGVSSPQSGQTIEPTYLNRRNDSGCPIYMLKPNYPQSLPPSLLHRNGQGQQNSLGYVAVSQEEKTGTFTWKPPETHQASGAVGSAVKKRRRSSPVPIIVIKDEPDDDSSYVQANHRASLPDSTGDQPQISGQGEGNKVLTPLQSTDDKPQSPLQPSSSPWVQSETKAPNHIRSLGEPQVDQHQAPLKGSNEGLCAACQTGGELLCCHKCAKLFHLSCHVPTLLTSPSGEWFCSFCRDLLVPEMEYDFESKPETKSVKKEPDSEGGFPPLDKQKCERLLLHLFCSELSSDFQGSVSPSVRANNRLTIKGPMDLSAVRKRLEAKQSLCYQSPAEFVADIRLVFGNRAVLSEADTEVAMAARKLKELFEEHLRVIFPDKTFPEIKLEMIPTAPPDSQLSSLDNIFQHAKRQRTYSDSQDTPSCPSGEGVA
ncbi:hypothetical protein PFLUV_G00100580 [Perca fluviatilis]|uniref:PHD-type domain-containing protein n=3 Tax=Perca fluviatilis TaxID=8168 RepID=A0A6A5F5J1_PERFL|nr:hypothetical protein PFLUV_G00100580 [Perca fluviatilis]